MSDVLTQEEFHSWQHLNARWQDISCQRRPCEIPRRRIQAQGFLEDRSRVRQFGHVAGVGQPSTQDRAQFRSQPRFNLWMCGQQIPRPCQRDANGFVSRVDECQRLVTNLCVGHGRAVLVASTHPAREHVVGMLCRAAPHLKGACENAVDLPDCLPGPETAPVRVEIAVLGGLHRRCARDSGVVPNGFLQRFVVVRNITAK